MKKSRGIDKENTSSFYDANSGNLLVVTAKNEHYYPDDEIEDVFTKKFLIGCGLILLIVFVYLVILSIWYGNKFGNRYYMRCAGLKISLVESMKNLLVKRKTCQVPAIW